MTGPAYAEATVPAPRRADRADIPVMDRVRLQALAAGDDATLQATARRYEGLLRSAAGVILRSDVDVDEAAQRTWVLLLRNAGHQRPAVSARLALHRRPARGAGDPAGTAAHHPERGRSPSARHGVPSRRFRRA